MRIWRPINRVEKIEEYRAWQQAAKEHRLEAELAHLLAHDYAGTSHVGDVPIEEAIKDTNIDNLKIITSNVDLSGLEVETASENRRAFLLRDKISNFINIFSNIYNKFFFLRPATSNVNYRI